MSLKTNKLRSTWSFTQKIEACRIFETQGVEQFALHLSIRLDAGVSYYNKFKRQISTTHPSQWSTSPAASTNDALMANAPDFDPSLPIDQLVDEMTAWQKGLPANTKPVAAAPTPVAPLQSTLGGELQQIKQSLERIITQHNLSKEDILSLI